jgi:DNA (cytosine-5)-methyltransferase 1
MRSGELFAGVGGLGMAVDEAFEASPAWFAEFDAAPSKVLAYRYPDVPNLGDVTKADWASLEHVDILAGGFPCQDVSLAGARRGMKDGTRSGLWSEYVKAIDIIRPDWVVIENVRGLISARADSEVEPCPWCVGDGGDEYHLRALDAVLADLSRLGYDATWTPLRAADVGAPHGRYRFFILAWPADADLTRLKVGRSLGGDLDAELASAERGDPDALTLLPTPIVSDGTGGPKQLQGARFAPQLREITQLLPTPGAYDGERGGSQHPDKRRDGGRSVTLQDVTEHLMPTPRATRGGSAAEMAYAMGGTRSDDERPQGVVVPGADWGPYGAAVARWETVLRRPAPSPVRPDGRGGKPRLNPELTEWMMGWPAGWVTDPAIGLTRAEQLKACGNGVVPQQATAALRILIDRVMKEMAA